MPNGSRTVLLSIMIQIKFSSRTRVNTECGLRIRRNLHPKFIESNDALKPITKSVWYEQEENV